MALILGLLGILVVSVGVALINSFKFEWYFELSLIILLGIAGSAVLSNSLKRATRRDGRTE